MQKHFDNILEFTKVREKCLFCETIMRAELTNFIGMQPKGLPLLSVPIDQNQFKFQIKHTTETYDVKANGVINAITNSLIFSLPELDTSTPMLDNLLAKQAFDDLKPHIDLYCPNKKCSFHYHISSYVFYIYTIQQEEYPWIWGIGSLKLFLEGFQTGSLNVQNDWFKEETNIYSNLNQDAEPLKFPIMDFSAIGKTKLLSRLQTLVVFS